MNLACLQFQPSHSDPEANLVRIVELLRPAAADLVVLPELATTGYLFPDRTTLLALADTIPGRTTDALASICARHGSMHVSVGIAERDGARLYNSAALVGPRGVIGIYRKTHLFLDEKDLFEPGNTGFEVFDIGCVAVGMLVCFDWIFPEAARSLALAGAQVIAHCSNLVLPYAQAAMITRCIENRVFWALANRTGTEGLGTRSLSFTGQSRIASPGGELLAAADSIQESLIVAPIEPSIACDKHITPRNDLFGDRRPDLYAASPLPKDGSPGRG